jgi:mannose-6-phosphate isomerase class I
MKEVCNLDADQVNYAWCFDGVPEENSVRYGFKESFIEFPAQDIVLFRPEEFMGKKVYDLFGKSFPIRFDFLDTMNGENLSLQVHPKTEYIQKYFGMNYTQEESYYILDAEEDATVYLGVKNDIDYDKFKRDLIEANQKGIDFKAEEYVNRIPVKKHDHLLIPAGTVHCSGKNTMVLEISSGVYIFTFKLWDWGRLGLDGLPRPVSLEHGFRNIKVEHDTTFVENQLVNQFFKVNDYEEITGLHSLQFIESRRYAFKTSVIMETKGVVNVCNLVEGQSMKVVSLDDKFEPFEVHYAETFYIPATIDKVKFISLDSNGCMVIKALVK